MIGTDSFFDFISRELTVLLIAVLPGIELRGALPIGVALGMPLWESFALSYLGSLIPIIPVMFLIKPLVDATLHSRRWRRFGRWLERRSLRHSRHVRRYRALGLFFFAALPLPGTGVWTASMIAGLLDLPERLAIISIAAGNLLAGLIVTFLTHQLG